MVLPLTQALNRLRGLSKGSEVWCLMRFDRVDYLSSVFWSTAEETGNIYVPENPGANTVKRDRKGVIRTMKDGAPQGAENGHTWRISQSNVTFIEAHHAEEYLCQKFDAEVAEYVKKRGHEPTLVEIYLKWSPCSQSSGGVPLGCGNKLINLVNTHPNISKWIVYYDKLYTGEGEGAARIMIAQMNGHAKIKVFDYQIATGMLISSKS